MDEWIYFLKNTKLHGDYKVKGLSLVDSQLKYDNMDTAIKQKYDQYLKDVRISKDMLETAKSKGKIEGKIDMILVLFDDKISITQIARYASLSEDEIIRILRDHGKI